MSRPGGIPALQGGADVKGNRARFERIPGLAIYAP